MASTLSLPVPAAGFRPRPFLASPWPWAGLAVLLHGGALALLLQHRSPAPVTPAAPVFSVSLLAPPAPENRPATARQASQPQPVRHQTPRPTPKVPVKSDKPAPQPLPVAPSASSAPSHSEAVAPAGAKEPAHSAEPVTEARFDAGYLQNPAPTYPPLSKRMGEQGKVLLRAHVLPNGTADGVEIKRSSGSPRLDNAALEAVRKWRFVPAKQGGQAIGAWVQIPINFSLEN